MTVMSEWGNEANECRGANCAITAALTAQIGRGKSKPMKVQERLRPSTPSMPYFLQDVALVQ